VKDHSDVHFQRHPTSSYSTSSFILTTAILLTWWGQQHWQQQSMKSYINCTSMFKSNWTL